MNQINVWMVIALTLVVLVVLLLAVGWVLLDWTAWPSGRSMSYDGTPMNSGVWRATFSPFMFLMPMAWLLMPICTVFCMIRWIGGGPRSRYFGTGYDHTVMCTNCGRGIQADWQVCPHCGQTLKAREVRRD